MHTYRYTYTYTDTYTYTFTYAYSVNKKMQSYLRRPCGTLKRGMETCSLTCGGRAAHEAGHGEMQSYCRRPCGT